MAKSDTPRVAILGAGPVGVEAALYARTLDWPVTVYERGRLGEHVRQWGHVRLFSPFGMNMTTLGRAAIRHDSPKHVFPADGDCSTGREHVTAYLEPLAATGLLAGCFQLNTEVLNIGRHGYLKDDPPSDPKRGQQPFRILLRPKDQPERVDEAEVILDCTGTYSLHRWLGDGGIPAVGELNNQWSIRYAPDDVLGERRSVYAGKNVLVVGAGYSAATTVDDLATLAAEQTATWVTWLTRGPSSQPIKRFPSDPLRERDRLAVRVNTLATRSDASVECFPSSVVDAIASNGPDQGFTVTARVAGKPKTWTVDHIVANVGFTPDTMLWRELHVHECYTSLGPQGLGSVSSSGPAALRTPEPNFFVLGAKSYGRKPNFLLKTGFEQVRDVFTLLSGKPDLDLYKDAAKKL